jgi:hypothetical protein
MVEDFGEGRLATAPYYPIVRRWRRSAQMAESDRIIERIIICEHLCNLWTTVFVFELDV